MLILARNVLQAIIIADNIRIEILGVRGNQVKLGIKAPHHVRVDREEVYNRRNAEHEISALMHQDSK